MAIVGWVIYVLVCLICMVTGLFPDIFVFCGKTVIRKDHIEFMKDRIVGLG